MTYAVSDATIPDLDTLMTESFFSDTRFKKTRDLVTKLIRLTIKTGSLTATIAVVDAILFLAVPDSNYHITPALILAKLYSNTLLVKFNSHITISHEGSQSHSTSLSADISTQDRIIFDTTSSTADPQVECIELDTPDVSLLARWTI